MTEPDTPPDIDPPDPIIPIGLSPPDVAREFAAAMSAFSGYRVPVIPTIPFELDWPLVMGVNDGRHRPFVLIEPGLPVIVSLFANISARLLDSQRPERVAEAKQQLATMRFGPLPHEAALTERECRFARAIGLSVLRFMIGDACLSALAGRDIDRARTMTLPDGCAAHPVRSLWLKNEPGWRPLASFVSDEARKDPFAPFPEVARAGVTLFLLASAWWEYAHESSNPTHISAELLEDTWCVRTIDAWRAALRDESGNDQSGYEWAIETIG